MLEEVRRKDKEDQDLDKFETNKVDFSEWNKPWIKIFLSEFLSAKLYSLGKSERT